MDNIENPKIGKFIIDILTTSMYEDCRFIFREYIQNSADQIDKAVEQGLIKKSEEGIFINIDTSKRTIEIEDNATGISQFQVATILQNVAESTKDKDKDKGFRGIGRLGGLGYCKKLIFETSYYGEKIKSIMTWDAQLLKEIINNRQNKENAVEVIQKVTTIITEPEDGIKHYFKVILEDVTNDTLIDKTSIEEYLKMVAPLPYPTGFVFKSKIKDYYSTIDNYSLDEYKIYLNNDQLFKAYTTNIYKENNGNKTKVDEIFEMQFFNEKDTLGNLLYWGWFGVSTFNGVIDDINLAKGIRLRKNNIQIGSKHTLLKLHKEKNRGNYYFFGEVHVVNNDLIPNSRRDYFSENKTCHLFEDKLSHYFYTSLYRIYQDSSKIRSLNKDVQALAEFEKTVTEKVNEGFSNHDEKKKLYEEFESKKKKAEESKKKLDNLKQKNDNKELPISKIFERIVNTDNIKPSEIEIKPDGKPTKFKSDDYSWLPKSERKLISKFFTIIENVLSKDMAKNLIAKIDEELKK